MSVLFLPGYATRPERAVRCLVLAAVLLVMLFLVAPIFVVVPLSFSREPFFTFPIPEYSLRWYRDFFASERWIAAVLNSLITASLTTMLATVLGTAAALGFSHPGFPWRKAAMAVVLSPMIVPVVITAVGAYLFYGGLGLVNTRAGLVMAHTALAVPFVIITVSATLATYDTNLTRAARSLGAPPLSGFLRVTLPGISAGVGSGAVLAFATSFDEVVVALYLTGPEQRTLPVQMFSGIRDQISPTIMAAATMLLALSILLFAAVLLIAAPPEGRLTGHVVVRMFENLLSKLYPKCPCRGRPTWRRRWRRSACRPRRATARWCAFPLPADRGLRSPSPSQCCAFGRGEARPPPWPQGDPARLHSLAAA